MLTPDEARQLLDVTNRERLAALYRLALTLGMRQAEILGLRWQDVDIDGRRLRVRQTLQRIGKEIVIKEPKTERSRRTLALTPSLVAALLAHKDRQEFERKRPVSSGRRPAWSLRPRSARHSERAISPGSTSATLRPQLAEGVPLL